MTGHHNWHLWVAFSNHTLLISWHLTVVGVTVQEDESDDGEVEEKERFLQTLLFVLSVVAFYAGTSYSTYPLVLSP